MKIIKNNYKFIFGIFTGLILASTFVYAATYIAASNQVSYNNADSGLTSTDVQGALDELYTMYNVNGSCPAGYTQYPLTGSDGFKCIKPMAFDTSSAVMDNISSTYVTSSTGVNFGAISSDTNGKGLYLMSGTENNAYPIYYYRGAVTNNNVLFANFCWKIVRTTETGGIKLVYNGAPANGKCTNTTGNATFVTSVKYNNACGDIKYVGYTYDNNGTETDSTVKAAVDNWYAENMTAYTSYLEDSVFL